MFSAFGDERKRKINLGGTSTVVSSTALLNQTRALRNERNELLRRHEQASKVQAWWRGIREARMVRSEVRQIFERDVMGLNGLRCLVVIARKDEDALRIWSLAMVNGGSDALFTLARVTECQESWLVLIRQAALLLLRSVADSPSSASSLTHLKVLNTLLSPTKTTEALGDAGTYVSAQITLYLLNRNLYSLLSHAITSIPISARVSPALTYLTTIATLPFSSLPAGSPEFISALNATFSSILTIPLLPNRIPSPALVQLSAHIPFAHIASINVNNILESTSPDDQINLAANLQVFVAPRYKVLDPKSHGTYFSLLAGLLNTLPVHIINPPPAKTSRISASPAHYDSDSEGEPSTSRTSVTVVTSFDAPPVPHRPLSPPDARTLKRLATLPTLTHLSSLFALPSSPSSRPALFQLLFALSTIWPADVAPRVLAAAPALVRELYRGYVRGSSIGRDNAGGALGQLGAGGDNASTGAMWAPFLLLVDLYTKAMVTMGDDEFFGTTGAGGARAGGGGRTLGGSGGSGFGGAGAGSVHVARNPLSLDELVEWSRKLMNVAFALYWREDRQGLGKAVGVEEVSGPGVRCTWESVRERVTKCLVGIHARDSRKPFVPPGHWLVTSLIDVQSFVDAAIFEERELSSNDTDSPALPISGSQALSKRQLAQLSPRLGVLNNIPFAIPFDVRVSIFRHFVINDSIAHARRQEGSQTRNYMFYGHGRTRVQVRRGNVAQDGFDRLSDADLKAPVEIAFIDQFGAEEAGIDGGGVFKEFFTSLCKEVFDTDRGLCLNWYRFIGRILGKAMYQGILVDVAFAGFFLAKWLGKQSFLDDLASLDPELYNGLVFLKHYMGNLEDLALNFTIAVDELGVTKAVDLIPNGSNVAVTKENRLQYIQLVSHYRLTKQIKLQSEAFFEGLSDMIDPKWIRMFNQQEIQILIGGVNTPIDFADLRGNTNYGGLYDDNEETIVMFWNVVNTFNQEQRMALLRFVTSCSRPPLLGFKELAPLFSIRDASADQHRLPTASTCVNLLKLPRYKTEKVLRDKLLQAINSNAGFDLS